MKVLVAGGSQRSRSTGVKVANNHSSSSAASHLMSLPLMLPAWRSTDRGQLLSRGTTDAGVRLALRRTARVSRR